VGLLAVVKLILSGYFKNVTLDPNPRLISNIMNDKYYTSNTVKARSKIWTRGFVICSGLGVGLVALGGLAFIICGYWNEVALHDTTIEVDHKTRKLIDQYSSLGPQIKRLNEMNIEIPRGLHHNELFAVKNLIPEIAKANNDLHLQKLNSFKKILQGSSLRGGFSMIIF
jgi:hypothetical protein